MITKAVLDKDEYFLWSVLQWHQSCHSNEMTSLPILLAQEDPLTWSLFLGTSFRNCRSFNIWNSWTNLMTSSQLLRSMILLHLFLHHAISIYEIDIIHFSWVYHKPIQWPSPSCLAISIGRALHRYPKGQAWNPGKSGSLWLPWSSLHWYVTATTTNTLSQKLREPRKSQQWE